MSQHDSRTRAAVAAGAVSTTAGFAAGIALLAVVSLLAIPVMITAAGPRGWAAVATGQAVGAVAALMIAYGWGTTGPARVARARGRQRLTEFAESLTVRLTLVLPLGGLAAAVAAAVAVSHPGLAALGAASAASVGLTANWYFVGTRRPYRLLALEMVPRAAGTLAGIAAVRAGAGAEAVLGGQLAGMAAAVLASGTWIVSSTPERRGWWRARRGLLEVLARQRHGVFASTATGLYAALPIVLVGLLAPGAQPAFAVLDKVAKQVASAVSPVVTVLQGWVPGGPDAGLRRRAARAVAAAALAGGSLLLGAVLAGEHLIRWLGGGRIAVPGTAVLLLGLVMGTAVVGAVLTRAVLVALGELPLMTGATLAGSVTGLALVALLAGPWGLMGALTGVLAGHMVKVAGGLTGLRRRAGGPR